MGEMADYFLTECVDDYWDYTDYSSKYDPISLERCKMADLKECNRCGVGGLAWKETDDGWRLFDEKGKQHLCKKADKETSLKEKVIALCKDDNHAEVHKIVEAYILEEDPCYFDDRYEVEKF